MKAHTMRRSLPMMVLATATTLAAGCASDNPSEYDRARSDPMNYQPGSEWPDVSGGGLGQFDKKGFKQDLNNVLNP
jgi:hypothetical protein